MIELLVFLAGIGVGCWATAGAYRLRREHGMPERFEVIGDDCTRRRLALDEGVRLVGRRRGSSWVPRRP